MYIGKFNRKDAIDTEDLAKDLLEELNVDTSFTIPIFGGIAVAESVVITWVIILVLWILSVALVRNLKIENISRKQLALESTIGGIYGFLEDIIGQHGKRYIPYLMTVAIYLGIANLIGLIGFKPPTKDLGVTAALAIMSIVLVEYASIRGKGFRGWLKSFVEPIAIIAPINILEIFIRPLSLCMRLFGNILGAFVVMELIKLILPILLPIPFSIYFDIFDGLIQAYVFVFLTSLFLREAVE